MTNNQKTSVTNNDRELQVDVFNDNGKGWGFMLYANKTGDEDYGYLTFAPKVGGRVNPGSVVSITIPGGWSRREEMIDALIGLGKALEGVRAQAVSPEADFDRSLQEAADAMTDETADTLTQNHFGFVVVAEPMEGPNLAFNTTSLNAPDDSEYSVEASLLIDLGDGRYHLRVTKTDGGKIELDIGEAVSVTLSSFGTYENFGFVNAFAELGERLKPLAAAHRRQRD